MCLVRELTRTIEPVGTYEMKSSLNLTNFHYVRAKTIVLWLLSQYIFVSSINTDITYQNIPSASVMSLLSHLNNCHIKIFSDRNSQSEVTHLLAVLLKTFGDEVVYSLEQPKIYRFMRLGRPWRKVRVSFSQKCKCFVHLYLESPHQSNFPPPQVLTHKSYLSNPDYAIFVKFGLSVDLQWFPFTLNSRLYETHYMAPVFAIVNLENLYSLCILCDIRFSIDFRSNVESLEVENWKYFQKINMHGIFINADLGRDEKNRNLKTCHRILEYGPFNRPPTVEECIFRELSFKLNYTYKVNRDNSYATVKRRNTLTVAYYNNEIRRHKWEVLEHGMVFDQWGYLVVTEREKAYDTALTKPFDLWTWICLLFSCLCICILFITGILAESFNLFSIPDSFRVMTLIVCNVVASVLDQSVQSSFSKIYNLWCHKSIVGVWLLWSFAILIINQAYRGIMFSFLTLSPDPKFPDTLKALAESDLKIITFSVTIHNNQLRAIVSVNLEEVMVPGQVPGVDYPIYYEDFNKSIEFFSHNLQGICDFSAKVFLENNLELAPNHTVDWDPFPKNFGVFELVKHVDMQKHILQLYMPSKWVSSAIHVPNFMTRMPWTVTRNYFYPAFRRGLSFIYESGLYNRWDKYHDEINGLVMFYAVRFSISRLKVNTSKIQYAVPEKKWRNYYFSTVKRQLFSEPEPVSVEVLKTVWILSAIVLGFAILGFVLEISCGACLGCTKINENFVMY
ncbi:unnamed protein product [Orchesella dallaii]|uniref:Uncharacterized protein n=1 Tax=Orchesella dallaii TaxID=48710 RepID=A0ABP1RCS3_9HEXA